MASGPHGREREGRVNGAGGHCWPESSPELGIWPWGRGLLSLGRSWEACASRGAIGRVKGVLRSMGASMEAAARALSSPVRGFAAQEEQERGGIRV